jgi:hypothetical protein
MVALNGLHRGAGNEKCEIEPTKGPRKKKQASQSVQK